jgi:membrane associated rhomboid family serine protease
MIPLRDHNPSGKLPFITYTLIAVNIIVFFFTFTLPKPALEAFISNYAVIPDSIMQGENLYTLITSIFLHGGFAHVFGNMLFLHIFGDNLEDRLGHIQYLIFYLVAGLSGSALQILINPSSTIPSLGASGAIAGVMGGYLVLYPRRKIDVLVPLGFILRTATIPVYFILFYWLIFQLVSGFGSLAYMDQMTGGIAYFAHVGGFASGWILVKLLVKKD